jgi:hypothetical protein
MTKSLEQYFIQFGHLDLPGIGSLKWSKQEAEWQDGVLYAPQEHILFDPIGDKPSKQCYNFLGDHLGCTSEQAALKLEQLIQQFKEQTVSNFELGSLGVIQKQADHYKWTTYYQSVDYYKNINVKVASYANNEIEEEASTSTKWWVWAISIAVIAIALILYKQL